MRTSCAPVEGVKRRQPLADSMLMRAGLSRTFLVLLTLSLPSHGDAQTYTWVGKDGSVHMTDDISEVPANQRKAKPETRDIQLVPGTPPPRRTNGMSNGFGPRGSSSRSRNSLGSQPRSSRPNKQGSSGQSESVWRGEYRTLNRGMQKVSECQAQVPDNCSRTRCSRYYRDYDSTCVAGWAVPAACTQAFKLPERTITIEWGSSRDLDNYSCEPLEAAVEKAEDAWQSKLDELDAKANLEGVPQNWRYD